MRMGSTPEHVGQAEDVVWEARREDAFLSSYLVFSNDEHLVDGKNIHIRGGAAETCTAPVEGRPPSAS